MILNRIHQPEWTQVKFFIVRNDSSIRVFLVMDCIIIIINTIIIIIIINNNIITVISATIVVTVIIFGVIDFSLLSVTMSLSSVRYPVIHKYLSSSDVDIIPRSHVTTRSVR